MHPCPNPCPRLCPQEQNSELQAKYQKLLVRTWGGAGKLAVGMGRAQQTFQTEWREMKWKEMVPRASAFEAPQFTLHKNPRRPHLSMGIQPVLQFASCLFIRRILCAEYDAVFYKQVFNFPF